MTNKNNPLPRVNTPLFSPEDPEFGFSSGSSGPSRRKFLKRTGGATAGALIGSVISNQKLLAKTDTISAPASNTNTPNWKIRSEEVGQNLQPPESETMTPLDESFGSRTNWVQNNVVKKVRRVLRLFAHAPESPQDNGNGDDQWAYSAICDVTINAYSWLQITDIVDGNPDENGWTDMTSTEYENWMDEKYPTFAPHSWEDFPQNVIGATLEKSIVDPSSPEIDRIALPADVPNNTASSDGIHLKLNWTKDDLNIIYKAVPLGIAQDDVDLITKWKHKNFGGNGQAE